MDPQQNSPIPNEPQPSQPASTPPQAPMPSMQQPGMMPGQPNPAFPQMSPAGGSTRGSLKKILIIAGVLLVAGAVVAATLFLKPKDKANNSNASTNTSQQQNETTEKASQFTAASLSDYQGVCKGNAAVNATDYTGGSSPHPIVLLVPSKVEGSYITSSVYLKDRSWAADYKNPDGVALVGCFSRKSEGAATKQCDLQDSNKQKVTIPLIPVIYNLDIYEAKTAKKIATKEIPGPVTGCPFLATYTPDDPKLYGDPDEATTQQVVSEFVTKD